MVFAFLLALAFTMNILGKSAIIICMFVTGLMAIYYCVKQRLWSDFLPLNVGLCLVVLTALSWFVSCYTGLDVNEAMAKWGVYVAISGFGYCIVNTLVGHSFQMFHFYKTVSIILVLCAFIVVCVQTLSWFDYLSISNLYGSVLAMGSPFVLHMAMRAQNSNMIWWVGLSILCMAVFVLGGRTGYVVLLICSVLNMIVYPWKDIKTAATTSFKVFLSVITGSMMGLYLYYMTVGDALYQVRVGALNMDRPASGRLEIWTSTLNNFYNAPYFGFGIKGFRELSLTTDSGHMILHAHNIVLELLIDVGLIGLTLFAITIAWFVMRFGLAYINIKDKVIRAQFLPVLIGFVGYGVACMALTSIFHTWWFLYLVLFIILISVSTRQMRALK